MTATALSLSKTVSVQDSETSAFIKHDEPQWTEELRAFDYGITDDEIIAEADKVVVQMLAYRFSDGVFSRTIMKQSDSDIACVSQLKDGEVADDIFFPERPYEEDFSAGAAPRPDSYICGTANPDYHKDLFDHDQQQQRLNEEFDRLERIADIRTARAKQICSSCPLRQMCLTNSIISDDMNPSTSQDWSEFGIFGGWGENARGEIRNEALAVLLAYDNDDLPYEDVEDYEVRAVELMREQNIPFAKERA